MTFSSDPRGRVTGVRGETTRGEPLRTTITYRRGVTIVTAPAGVVRTYHYDRGNRIIAVDAPGAAAHARQDAVSGVLDSVATTRRLE